MVDQDTNVPNKTDYISREAMHKANQDEWEGVYGQIDCDIFEDNENMIDRVPSADVRPVVRGKWIDVSPAHIKVFRCDQCGEETTDTCLDKPRANFCPNCGADMRGTNLDNTKGDNHGR